MSKNIIIIAVVFFLAVIWIIRENTTLELNRYTVTSERLPKGFDGYRIAHISDLHNAENKRLIPVLKDAEPDIIAITGDLIDSRRTDIAVALRFADEAMKIAPCYYVTGNHESRVDEFKELKEGLLKRGVVVLCDERLELEQFGETIELLGVNDPSFRTKDNSENVMKEKLRKIPVNKDVFSILLSHRPELIDIYAENNIDLVLSGHAHGGQIRIPFVGGVIAPHQGFFPKYDGGIYTDGNTNMIVSRGIGNSAFPFRVNNRPELVLIELKSQD